MRCPSIQFATQTQGKHRTLTYLERQYSEHTQRKRFGTQNKRMHEKMEKKYGGQDNRGLWNNSTPLCRRRLIKSTNYSWLCDARMHARASTHAHTCMHARVTCQDSELLCKTMQHSCTQSKFMQTDSIFTDMRDKNNYIFHGLYSQNICVPVTTTSQCWS